MPEQVKTRGDGGEYSTVLLPGNIIETCFLPDDPAERSRVIGRTVFGLRSIQREHIAADDGARR